MTESKYFKAVTDKGTEFYAVQEDDTIAEFYLEDIQGDEVHIDSDQSWHWHDYDFDLLDGLEFEDVLKLVKKAIDNISITYGDVTVSEFEDDAKEFEDVEDVKQWLDAVAGYYLTDTLYSLVNEADNTIKAFTVNGYSQGDGAFVWYDTSVTEGVYTPEYVQSVLYDMWYSIDLVSDDGVILDNAEYVNYVDNDYMKEHFNAVPAMENVTMQLS